MGKELKSAKKIHKVFKGDILILLQGSEKLLILMVNLNVSTLLHSNMVSRLGLAF